MISNRHITKIIAVIMAFSLCLCFAAMYFSAELTAAAGGKAVSMSYESELFDTDVIMTVNILMDEDDWQEMLDNALEEEYYACDVEVNGKTFYQVGIRTKGNTSLSSVVNDPTTDRYSLKLEFDHYVDGQTCFGLDKLVLNNNYADATNMKEALCYDMFQFLGADASLYNYAEISVNGEYRGVYLALEAVEDSFLLRNYGTEKGALYKPEGMEMGGDKQDGNMPGGGGDREDAGNMPDFGDISGGDSGRPDGNMPNAGAPGGGDNGNPPSRPDGNLSENSASSADDSLQKNGFPGDGGPGGEMPNFGDFTADDFSDGEMPDFSNFSENGGFPGGDNDNPPSRPDGGGDREDAGNMPGGGGDMPDFSDISGGDDGRPSGDMPGKTDQADFGGMGGFSKSSGGADLNYTDDDLDSYSTIWDGEVTDTKKADHKRVVKALKNISEGTDLETYMDIDNLLKYMAVHVFSVNMDSLSGNMAHNYYLYESNGQLNLIPWDYNLAFGGMGANGGMGGGSSDSATEVVNSAIDNAFSGTEFFDTLMENETYREQYYAYLNQLVEEYVYGDGFETFYNRTRNLIDTLVETDPTAFYTYEEYQTAADTLYQIVKLRAQSIEGQLNGTIPSTSEEQSGSDALIDASSLSISAMGTMNTGGRR